MPIIDVIRTSLAVIISIASLAGLYIMFTAESSTASDFTQYFQWALGAGIVFLGIGAALTIFDREDSIATELGPEKRER